MPDAPDLAFMRARPHPTSPGAGDLTFLRHRPRRPAAPPAPAAVPPAPAPAPPVPDPAAGPATAPALAGRTILSPQAPSVTVSGSQATSGPLYLTLGWSDLPTDPRSRRAGLRRSTDIHLGCLWEMSDGDRGVLQSLGDGAALAPGHGSTVLRRGPRSETEGETVTAALAQMHRCKRLLLFAYAYSGTPDWGSLGVVLTAELPAAVLEVRPGPAPPGAGVCALMTIHRVGRDLVVRREAAYLTGQQAAVAQAYGWDLPWADGRVVPPARTVR